MLISISGIDCSGKSTQIELLTEALVKLGKKPFVFWFRPGYSYELNTLKTMARKIVPSALPAAEEKERRNDAFSKPGVNTAWLTAAVVDMAFQYGAKLRALERAGYFVICDRYIHDSMLDLKLRFSALNTVDSPWSRLIYRVSPTPDARFLFTLPYDEMLRRMEQKQEPFPDPLEIREQRFHAYQRLAKTEGFDVVDAGQSVEQIHRDICQRLKL
ncbi:dTMP kinase [Bradymonas sediminis]|uniref:Uncharacterized protein n=1 Tax=Bradymonas sediminis TaxID=1548548 RepID=A0A2Z4FQV4_9DELT|nr:hypothetical protein [Bradymonas sediminis]AWV91145.1 hypothetical protein DN745_18155 [Bradymonas sediminis]TDP73704.1 thymidylate kinase [Bradymonas sediminis]